MKLYLSLTLCYFLFIFSAYAIKNKRKGPPPKEAIEACKDKSVGDSCDYPTQGAGVCKAPPANAPAPPHGGTPPNACLPKGKM